MKFMLILGAGAIVGVILMISNGLSWIQTYFGPVAAITILIGLGLAFFFAIIVGILLLYTLALEKIRSQGMESVAGVVNSSLLSARKQLAQPRRQEIDASYTYGGTSEWSLPNHVQLADPSASRSGYNSNQLPWPDEDSNQTPMQRAGMKLIA